MANLATRPKAGGPVPNRAARPYLPGTGRDDGGSGHPSCTSTPAGGVTEPGFPWSSSIGRQGPAPGCLETLHGAPYKGR